MERVTRRYVGHTVATKFRPGTHLFIHRNLLGSFLFSRARFANRISKNEGLGSTRGYLPHLLEAPSFMAKGDGKSPDLHPNFVTMSVGTGVATGSAMLSPSWCLRLYRSRLVSRHASPA